jgi:uncharacterized membrane protein
VGQDLELPPPRRLVRTTALNLIESIGFPIAALVIGAWLGGRDVGLLAGVGATWITAAIRKVVTGSVPGLVTIMVVILTLQTALAVGTGDLWIFLLHFPLANLVLCVLFARTARSDNPLAEKLAGEVICLRQPPIRQQCLLRFFQGATWLWASVFLLLGGCMGALLATQTAATFVLYSVVATVALIVLGIVASTLWLRTVLHRHQLGLRFARTLAAPKLVLQSGPRHCGRWPAAGRGHSDDQASKQPGQAAMTGGRNGKNRASRRAGRLASCGID